jgi:hypothetical protein
MPLYNQNMIGLERERGTKIVKGAEKGEGDEKMKLKSLWAVYVENFHRAMLRRRLVTASFLFQTMEWLGWPWCMGVLAYSDSPSFFGH